MTNGFIPIGRDEAFRFSCSAEVSCFNECCRDLNQFLTPYDVLRLKSALGMDSAGFLEHFTTRHIGPETGLPVVAIKTDPASNHVCPFVSPAGCRAYRDRPTSCRMYPLARAVSRSRKTGQMTEHFALLKEAHCRGHEQTKRHTVGEWMVSQGLAPYNAWNDRLLELIALKNQRLPGALDPVAGMRFYLALYNLDAFRPTAFQSGFFEVLGIDRSVYEQARQDDAALMLVGIDWLKQTVFKE